MNKFLKILKYVFSLGILLYTDYQKEKSKTKVLIKNVSQLLEVAKDIRKNYDRKGIGELVKDNLNEEKLKGMLRSYQVANSLYQEIKEDVKNSK